MTMEYETKVALFMLLGLALAAYWLFFVLLPWLGL